MLEELIKLSKEKTVVILPRCDSDIKDSLTDTLGKCIYIDYTQEFDQIVENSINNNINRSKLRTNTNEIDTNSLIDYKELQKAVLVARRLRNCRGHENNATIELLDDQKLHFKNV